MKDTIHSKKEQYEREQAMLIEKIREHEGIVAKLRNDVIAYGGAIQACDQLLKELSEFNQPVATGETISPPSAAAS